MTTKPHIVVCATPVYGHVMPMRAIAKALIQRGYEVTFVSMYSLSPKVTIFWGQLICKFILEIALKSLIWFEGFPQLLGFWVSLYTSTFWDYKSNVRESLLLFLPLHFNVSCYMRYYDAGFKDTCLESKHPELLM